MSIGWHPTPKDRIVLLRLERFAADQVRVFIRLEIAQADDDPVWMLRRCDAANAVGEKVDEVLGLVLVSVVSASICSFTSSSSRRFQPSKARG
jgi:hypothetical protein